MDADKRESRDRDPETFAIIGAAMAVHSELGSGFLEQVYQEALAVEFAERSVLFAREVPFTVPYKGRNLNAQYRADFVCFNSIVVELKAISELRGEHVAQVLNYLKATRMRRGLLFNFGEKQLKYERVVLNY
jgi:GxxExxY protein